MSRISEQFRRKSADRNTWYVRNADEVVYGPVSVHELCQWVAQCRVLSETLVSHDRDTWIQAVAVPELHFVWMIDKGHETVGPYNLAAVPLLMRDGVIAAEALLMNPTTGQSIGAHEIADAHVAVPDVVLNEHVLEWQSRYNDAKAKEQELKLHIDSLEARQSKNEHMGQARIDALHVQVAEVRQSLEQANVACELLNEQLAKKENEFVRKFEMQQQEVMLAERLRRQALDDLNAQKQHGHSLHEEGQAQNALVSDELVRLRHDHDVAQLELESLRVAQLALKHECDAQQSRIREDQGVLRQHEQQLKTQDAQARKMQGQLGQAQSALEVASVRSSDLKKRLDADSVTAVRTLREKDAELCALSQHLEAKTREADDARAAQQALDQQIRSQPDVGRVEAQCDALKVALAASQEAFATSDKKIGVECTREFIIQSILMLSHFR